MMKDNYLKVYLSTIALSAFPVLNQSKVKLDIPMCTAYCRSL